MKTPSALLWRLTKGHNAYVIRRNGQAFTRDPNSVNNLHCASDAGVSGERAVSITLTKGKAGKKGYSRREFNVNQRHSGKHSAKSRAGLVYSTQSLTKEVHRAAKVIDNLTVTPNKKAALKARLHRLHKGNLAETKA